jgi:predicted metal-dependent hydrolase
MTAAQIRPISAVNRYVKTRRIKFVFDPDTTPKHFVDNDLAQSHFVAVLSASFPAGEEAFIRSVRRLSNRVTDPVLRKQVQGFIGQEMTHGREHRNLNATLAEMGYPTQRIDEFGKRLALFQDRLPPLIPLAMTAAAEHYTATLAERVLSSPEIQELAYDEEVRNLLLWHALEELEHKSVAFDVYRAAKGPESVRIATMLFILATSIPMIVTGLLVSISADPAARNPVKTLNSLARLPRNPLLVGLTPTLLKYLRPGFHPDDIDTHQLLTQWQEELFGSSGSLVDHLRGQDPQ